MRSLQLMRATRSLHLLAVVEAVAAAMGPAVAAAGVTGWAALAGATEAACCTILMMTDDEGTAVSSLVPRIPYTVHLS